MLGVHDGTLLIDNSGGGVGWGGVGITNNFFSGLALIFESDKMVKNSLLFTLSKDE